MRFTIRRMLILMIALSVVSLVFVAPWFRRDREQAYSHYHEAVDNPEVKLSVFTLVDVLGYEETRALLVETSQDDPRFAIDSDGRFAQVQRQRNSTGQSTDIVWIAELSDTQRSYRWRGPMGIRIAELKFTPLGVEVSAYGDFRLDDTSYSVSQAQSLTLLIDWPKESGPTTENFFHQIYRQLPTDGDKLLFIHE